MSAASPIILARIEGARSRLADTKLPDPALRICVDGLARIEQTLARLPRVAILGKYGSGKMGVAGNLIAPEPLPECLVSETRGPIVISYTETPELFAVTDGGTRYELDVEEPELPGHLFIKSFDLGVPNLALTQFDVIDTAFAEDWTGDAIVADIAIWCTPASRPWGRTERVFWARLPPRLRSRACLAITEAEQLADRYERHQLVQSLTEETEGEFRHILFASNDPRWQPDAQALRVAVMSLANDYSDRRAAKADRIVRRLARLTLHDLAQHQAGDEVRPVLAAWETRASELLTELDAGTASPTRVIHALLLEFAKFLPRAHRASPPVNSSASPAAPAKAARRASPERRQARLLAADLTAMLRLEAVHAYPRDPALRDGYRTARSVLLSLTDMDATFAALGSAAA